MPQTVPSAGFSPPCDYTNFAADSFDLSLLPSDSEVPYSPTNLQQLMTLYCDSTGSPPPMFPDFLDDLQVLKTMSQQHKSNSREPFPLQQHPVKEEPTYFLHQGYPTLPQPSEPSSPAGSTASSTYTNNPSPYQQCPSPSSTHTIIKHEQTIDLQEILQESRLLQESLGSGRTPGAKKEPQNMAPDCALVSTVATGENSNLNMAPDKPSAERKPGDHQLLREVLRDMSFQRKYNLKPFDFDGLAASGFLAGTDARVKMETEEAGASCSVTKGEEGSTLMSIEPVLSLAIEQIRVDISNTCNVLGIASGKYQAVLCCIRREQVSLLHFLFSLLPFLFILLVQEVGCVQVYISFNVRRLLMTGMEDWPFARWCHLARKVITGVEVPSLPLRIRQINACTDPKILLIWTLSYSSACEFIIPGCPWPLHVTVLSVYTVTSFLMPRSMRG
jgi:hypothetical protein